VTELGLMIRRSRAGEWAGGLVLLAALATSAKAQVGPTATQPLALSVFGGFTGTYTGLEGGRNLGITAGADLEFRSHQFFSFQPAVELRGTYAVYQGQIDGQKNILGGLRETRPYGPLRIYGDILVGAGRLTYVRGIADPTNTFLYLSSSSFVISPGLGAELRITDRFALKGDVQLQHYSTPVISSGRIYARPFTLGIVYRFDRNHQAGRFVP